MSVFRQLMMRNKGEEANYIDLSIVGALAISDGVVSGFSSSNYLQSIPQISLGNDFEFYTVFTTGTLSSSNEVVLTGKTNQYINYGHEYGYNVHRLQYNIGNGSSWWASGGSQTYGANEIQSNTKYYNRLVCEGTAYKAYLSTDGINWALDWSFSHSGTIPSFILLYGVGRSLSASWQGTIDIGSSYLKIGNTKYLFQFALPLTKVGSPTISSGVASGFSTSNYLTGSKSVNLSTQTVELVFDITMTDFTSSGLCMFATSNFTIQFYADNTTSFKKLNLGGNPVAGNKQFLLNTNYKIKAIFKVVNGVRTLEIYYLNGNSWVLDVTYTNLSFSSFDTFILGDNYTHSGTRVFKGSYNLNNSYIKIDGTKYAFTV